MSLYPAFATAPAFTQLRPADVTVAPVPAPAPVSVSIPSSSYFSIPATPYVETVVEAPTYVSYAAAPTYVIKKSRYTDEEITLLLPKARTLPEFEALLSSGAFTFEELGRIRRAMSVYHATNAYVIDLDPVDLIAGKAAVKRILAKRLRPVPVKQSKPIHMHSFGQKVKKQQQKEKARAAPKSYPWAYLFAGTQEGAMHGYPQPVAATVAAAPGYGALGYGYGGAL